MPSDFEEDWIDAVAKILVKELGWNYQVAWNHASNEAEDCCYPPEDAPTPEEGARAFIEQLQKEQNRF